VHAKIERVSEQIPVEGLEVPELKNQAMAFGNRAFVKGVGRQQIEKRIGLRASIRHSRKQG